MLIAQRQRFIANLITAFILIPSLLLTKPCIAQPKKGEMYFKINPGIFFPKDGDNSFSFLGAIGPKFKSAAIGVGIGYFKISREGKAFIPFGIDMTFSEFGKKKIGPAFSMGFYYPVHNHGHSESYNSGSAYVSVTSKTQGKFQFRTDGGIALPVTARTKLLITGGYSLLFYSNSAETRTRIGTSTSTKTAKESNNLSIYILSVSLII